jgi:A nuclease of the HNH/ENDO VII superfamily with conserved WHH/Domain of unknown function (DUF4150)
MADKHIADCESGFKVIAMGPDACKVGKPVIPFDSMQTLSNKQTHSNNVNARGEPVLHVGSIVNGTQSNAGQGVVSGTSGGSGHCVILTGAASVCVNGQPTARHESLAAINNGNTIAQVNSGTAAPNGAIDGNQQPCNQRPQTSETLDKLKQWQKDLQDSNFNPDKLDGIVDFKSANETLDSWIAGLRPSDDSWAVTKIEAGRARAEMGFLKDGVMGLGQLLYMAAKAATPQAIMLRQIDGAILAENVRLGNVCVQSVADDAKKLKDSIVKGVTKKIDEIGQAWTKGDIGDKTQIATRAGLEIVTLAAGVVTKAAAVAKAAQTAQAVKLAEAAQVAEAAAAQSLAAAQKISEAAKAADLTAEIAKIEAAAEVAKGKKISKATAGKPKAEPDGVVIKKKRKPSQPNKKKWEEKGGKVKENPDGSTTYTSKDGKSVTYNKEGYPDFSEHKMAEVKIDNLSGDYIKDAKMANEASNLPKNLGIDKSLGNVTWHHVEDGKTMQLIPKLIHDEFSHTGGASILRSK